jgi:hypothetical protein
VGDTLGERPVFRIHGMNGKMGLNLWLWKSKINPMVGNFIKMQHIVGPITHNQTLCVYLLKKKNKKTLCVNGRHMA